MTETDEVAEQGNGRFASLHVRLARLPKSLDRCLCMYPDPRGQRNIISAAPKQDSFNNHACWRKLGPLKPFEAHTKLRVLD
jgi:hypothetical protein